MNIETAGARGLADLRDRKAQEVFGPEIKLRKRYARFGEFALDLQRQDLIRNGERARIPGKVFQVLVTMLERPGEIVSREDLRTRLWASDTHVNFEANLNTTVNKLRQILGDSNERSVYVQTVPRKGYSFIGEVEFVREMEDSAAHKKLPGIGGPVASEVAALGDPGSAFLGVRRSQVWFAAGVIALTIAAMMLGAAITLFSYHHS